MKPPAELSYLSLGSNLGNRDENLDVALRRIREDFPGARFSSRYETQPILMTDQPCFLNQLAEVKTRTDPHLLLQWALDLERLCGRQREVPKGPRTLDVDILLCGNRVLEDPGLILPHPGLLKRRHVLVPLSELNPELRIPPHGISAKEALRQVEDDGWVRKI